MFELASHDLWASHEPMEHRLVDHAAKDWRPGVLASQDGLALDAYRDRVVIAQQRVRAADDVLEVAELLASELVTNALTHGAEGVPATSTIRISVSREQELIVVAVYDSCIVLPRVRRAGHLDICGRGLAIVQTFSHNWGWTLTPCGKSVWFQLVAWP